jgi:phage terminase large subunit-like protein
MKAGPKALPPLEKLPPLRARTPAGRVEEFCRRFLRHCKGRHAGAPLILAPWQIKTIVKPLFDTQLPSGLRQYRTCYCTMPRKNGKSTLGAAIALYMLYADDEPGAEIISAAADTDQAAIVFDVAKSMVEASPALRDMTQIYRRELVIPPTGSRYRVISAEAGTKHGMNLSCAICDELHVWTSRDLFDVLATSTGAREQPLILILTTAGDDEHGICAEVHHHAERVLEGTSVDPTLLPIVYAASKEADPWDPAVWAACNPALVAFRSLEEMQTAAQNAQLIPGREPAFRRLYLNQWGVNTRPRWLNLTAWDACQIPPLSPPLELGRPVFLGLDLSTTVDLSCLICLLPDDDGGYQVRADFWCPENSIDKRSQQDGVPYRLWVSQGFLTATPGDIIDYSYIEARLHTLMRDYAVQELAFDPWNARHLVAKLQQDNMPAVEVSQTMANLTSASKALEILIMTQKLRHDGHPILRWCVANAVADLDGNGNIKPSKKRSTERIDGVSALVTALARALVAAPNPSAIFEARGLLVL